MENLKLENIKGKKYAIHCSTQEQFDIISKIYGSSWENTDFDHKDFVCIHYNGVIRNTIIYFLKKHYTIIPAKDFIEANTVKLPITSGSCDAKVSFDTYPLNGSLLPESDQELEIFNIVHVTNQVPLPDHLSAENFIKKYNDHSVSKDSLHTETESKKEFTLPEKYYVKGYKEVVQHYNKVIKTYLDYSNPAFEKLYFYFPECEVYNYIKTGYTEITLEQFKEHVLKEKPEMKREIIGYKAPFDMFKGKVKKGALYERVIVDESDNTYGIGTFSSDNRIGFYKYILPSEIVETWEPVYKEEPKEFTREEITAKWVRDNDVKVGGSIRLINVVSGVRTGTYQINEISSVAIGLNIGIKTTLWVNVEDLEKVVEPVKEYVAYTFEDRDTFRDKWVRYKNSKIEARISSIYGENSEFDICTDVDCHTFKYAFENIEKLDGTPFGKQVIK